MRLHLEVHSTDGSARTGLVRTVRGEFRTPVFMPVGTRGAIRSMSTHELATLRAMQCALRALRGLGATLAALKTS